jgi:hypothetical protein
MQEAQILMKSNAYQNKVTIRELKGQDPKRPLGRETGGEAGGHDSGFLLTSRA